MQVVVDYLWSLGPWNWFIAAVALFVLETIVPGVHFLWFGLAAAVVGTLALATGVALPVQLIAFALIACATAFWLRRTVKPGAVASSEPTLNERGAQYVGRLVTVEEAIAGGRGKVRVGDTLWAAEGPDAAAGEKVRVIGATGTVLRISAGG